MPSPKLYKTIFQARYKAELKFYELLIPAAKQMTEFPDWETNRLSVTLKNFDRRCNLSISHNSFSYDQDSNDIEIETNYINKALEILPSALEIESFIRLGFRRRYLIPVEIPFDSLIQMLNIKLLSQEKKLREVMPANVKDLMYRIDSEEEGFKYHFLIGPVSKQEIPKYVEFNRQHNLNPANREEKYRKIVQEYPDVAIFIDIDLFQEKGELQAKKAANFVNNARSKVDNLTRELCNYLLEEKVE